METPVRAGIRALVGGPISLEQFDRIRQSVPDVELVYCPLPSDIEAYLHTAEVVAGSMPGGLLARSPGLKWIQGWAAGTDGLLSPELLASSVIVTSCKSNGAWSLAEHALMLMLMLNRDMPRWSRAQTEHRWDYWRHPEINGLTCGIIGLGFSGQDLARKARAFHMRVVGIRRTLQPTPDVDRVYTRAELPEMLAESDFVVVTAPRTPETLGMLGDDEFRAMKKSAFYVCISRGGIANDDSLLRALREGWIAGAGLDAHSTEPLPPDSPFWTAPNTIVTPHGAASTPQSRERGVDIFIDNLRRYSRGQLLVNIVDKAAGY